MGWKATDLFFEAEMILAFGMPAGYAAIGPEYLLSGPH